MLELGGGLMFSPDIVTYTRLESCRILWRHYRAEWRRAKRRKRALSAQDYRKQMRDMVTLYAGLREW